MKFKKLIFSSIEHQNLITLRDKILRKPLGLSFSAEELANEKHQFHFGLFEKNMLIGGLILVAMPNKTIKMRQVCIDENFQRKGYGEYLELQAEKWAKNKGFELMFCHARENALSFYQKLNYLQKGEPFEEVGLVHYYLEKQL